MLKRRPHRGVEKRGLLLVRSYVWWLPKVIATFDKIESSYEKVEKQTSKNMWKP